MSERRLLRLSALALVVFGGGGTMFALIGLFDDADGTLAFPVSVVVGIVALIKLRPRTPKGSRKK